MVLRLCKPSLSLTLALALGACSGSDDAEFPVVVIGSANAPFENGARLSAAGQLVRGAVAEGLVAFDAQGRAVPALADRWIVTDDGLSYIFRLRDGSWQDGTPLTALAVRSALQNSLARLRGTSLSADLSAIAEVRAMAGRVIEIRLSQTNPDLLQLLAQPELGLTKNGRGAGPMRMKRKGNAALLSPIAPGKRGLPEIDGWDQNIRDLRIAALSAELAIKQFREGDTDLVLGGRFEDLPLARNLGLGRGKVQLDPVTGLFGLVAAHENGFLAKAENREALAMSIDRDALAGVLNADGWTPTTRIVAPGMAGDSGEVGERWQGRSLEDRREVAAARVAKEKSGRDSAVKLRIALPSGPGADLVFARLAEDFTAIGIESQRVGMMAEADLRLIDSVARAPRASWFIGQLACSARKAVCSSGADIIAQKALREADATKRASLYAEAEAELLKTNGFIPLGSPLRWSLLRGDVAGFAPNRWGIHPLMPLASVPK